MPNNVVNSVAVTGNGKDLLEFKALVHGDSEFDFNTIIPMPAPLRDVRFGATTIDGVSVREWLEVDGKSVPITESTRGKWLRQYGATNWYDWSIKNWGTKWNAYDVSFADNNDELYYQFMTAWDTPEPIISALADRFPTLKITVHVGGEVDRPYNYSYGPMARATLRMKCPHCKRRVRTNEDLDRHMRIFHKGRMS